mmetsp:Transcript_14435/g.36533  ORF Transcript_14435/g.36533 Transcript_14435/m.36533 type:complete len:200 (+) Transcript_14435:230-829(+)
MSTPYTSSGCEFWDSLTVDPSCSRVLTPGSFFAGRFSSMLHLPSTRTLTGPNSCWAKEAVSACLSWWYVARKLPPCCPDGKPLVDAVVSADAKGRKGCSMFVRAGIPCWESDFSGNNVWTGIPESSFSDREVKSRKRLLKFPNCMLIPVDAKMRFVVQKSSSPAPGASSWWFRTLPSWPLSSECKSAWASTPTTPPMFR